MVENNVSFDSLSDVIYTNNLNSDDDCFSSISNELAMHGIPTSRSGTLTPVKGSDSDSSYVPSETYKSLLESERVKSYFQIS